MARLCERPPLADGQSPITDASRVDHCEMRNGNAGVQQLGNPYPGGSPGTAVVTLPPALSDDITALLGQRLRELARRPGIRLLILDARDTVDASVRGLALIIAVSRTVRSRGGGMRVVNAGGELEVLLRAAECV